MESTGVNGFLHQIIILCEGPVRAINEIWLDDYVIPNDWINADGEVVAGRYTGVLTIRKHLGSTTQNADPLAVANMPEWTNDHRLQGIAYLYVIAKKDQDKYPNGIPNISAIVEGPELYDPRIEDTRWTTNMAVAARGFLSDSRYGFGVLDQDIDDDGVIAQANICDEIVDTEYLESEVSGIDVSADLIVLGYDDVLPFQFGDRVRVTTTGTYPGGLDGSTDYYVIPFQVKTTPRIRLAASLDDAMAKTHINITSAGTGTRVIRKTGEPRYHGGGIHDTETVLSQTLNDLVNSMAGRAVNTGGFWTLLAGAWRTPATTIGIDDIRGNGIGIKTDLSLAESYNVVKGLFVSPQSLYQPTDYPSARYEEFIQDDNNQESPKELNLPFTQRSTTAQRIAKIELFRGRQAIVVTCDISTFGLRLQPGDNTSLTIDRYGFEEKEFEVTQFGFIGTENEVLTRLTLRETAQEIFDWSEGEAITFDPAPNTNLPDPFDVAVPTGVGYNSRSVGTQNGDEVFVLQLFWDEHPDQFVTQFGDFEIQYKPSSAETWLPSFFVDGQLTQSDVFSSSVGVFYDMRIRARNNLGVRSAWVTLTDVVVGSSGGVGSTEDWETFSDPVGSGLVEDWETFSDPVGSGLIEDWGYFT